MTDVRPFLVPAPATIRPGEWNREVDQQWEPLQEHLRDWDQATTLHLSTGIAVDAAAVRSTTRLHHPADLGWTAGWRAADSGLIGAPTVVPFGDDHCELTLTLPPERAGAVVVLTRRLVLLQDRDPAPGEAHRAGSVLWEDATAVRLTGTGSAFPTEIVDFGTARGAGASWYLDLPAAVDVAAMGSMVLEINAADTALVRAVTRARRPDDHDTALLAHLEEGVVEELVHWALARWEYLQDTEPDSIGALAHALTNRVLPDPATWTGPDVDTMALRAAVISGARELGFGRRL